MEKLNRTIGCIKTPDSSVYEKALARLADQARPAGSLGILENVSARLAAIAGTLDVRLENKVIVTCAGDHGVVAEGVSLFPQEVTPQMVLNFVGGGASINVLGKHAGARVIAADLGVNYDFDPALPIFHKKVGKGTANFAKGPAMTREEAIRSIDGRHRDRRGALRTGAGESSGNRRHGDRQHHAIDCGHCGIFRDFRLKSSRAAEPGSAMPPSKTRLPLSKKPCDARARPT